MAEKIILIIEGEDNVRDTLGLIFDGSGYTVIEANSADKAFAFFQSNPVDVVLLECGLRDGAWLGKTLKEMKPHVPIAVLSADSDAAKSLSYADLLLPKPIDPAELLERIAELLKPPSDSEAA